MKNRVELIQEIKDLISKTLSNEEILNDVIHKSVEHDNGFLKIVLRDRFSADFGCRIHQWKSGQSDSNIHSHRWEMYSLILKGSYTADEYILDESGETYFYYNFLNNGTGSYKILPASLAKLKAIKQNTYVVGEGYQVRIGEIHKISRVHDKGALTAVLSWNPESSNACVFSSSELPFEQAFQRKLCKKEVVETLMAALSSAEELINANR